MLFNFAVSGTFFLHDSDDVLALLRFDPRRNNTVKFQLVKLIAFREILVDNALTITYYISVPSFSIIKSHIDDFLKFYKSADNKNEFFTDSFEESFRSELVTFNNIEEEIEFYK